MQSAGKLVLTLLTTGVGALLLDVPVRALLALDALSAGGNLNKFAIVPAMLVLCFVLPVLLSLSAEADKGMRERLLHKVRPIARRAFDAWLVRVAALLWHGFFLSRRFVHPTGPAGAGAGAAAPVIDNNSLLAVASAAAVSCALLFRATAVLIAGPKAKVE